MAGYKIPDGFTFGLSDSVYRKPAGREPNAQERAINASHRGLPKYRRDRFHEDRDRELDEMSTEEFERLAKEQPDKYHYAYKPDDPNEDQSARERNKKLMRLKKWSELNESDIPSNVKELMERSKRGEYKANDGKIYTGIMAEKLKEEEGQERLRDLDKKMRQTIKNFGLE